MRIRLKVLSLLVLVLAVGSDRAFPAPDAPAHGPHIVLIIRHAEKPEPAATGEKDPNLSPRGYQRADALAKVIPDRFPKPDILIATKRSKGSNRPVETITPLAKALNEEIASTYNDDEVDQLAHELLTADKYTGKTVLIAWHHGKIPALAKALGVKDAPDQWPAEFFDRVWEITYTGDTATWQDLPQKALPGDAEK